MATRANIGGVARWLEVLLAQASREGDRHTLAVGLVREDEIEFGSLPDDVVISLTTLGHTPALRDDFRTLSTLRALIADLRPDVVNTHMSKGGLLGRLASRSLGRKRPGVVHTMHGHVMSGYFGPFKSEAIILAERASGRMTDEVIAVGRQVAVDLVDLGVSTPSRVSVIRPGVPDRAWLPRAEARGILGLDLRSDVAAGWLGRHVRIKRPDRLVGAALRVPDVTFVVGGGGPLESELDRRAPRNMSLVGWVDPVPFWSACDIAVLTSDNEGVPTALVEASLAGLPSVTTNAGSVTDIVVDGVTGLVVERNAGAVAEAVRFLAADADARSRMGKAARERALTEFSPERMWADHQVAYQKALEHRWRRR